MNNRHVSADDVYPFVPFVGSESGLTKNIVDSIKDIYAVIRPDAGSATVGVPDAPTATLASVTVTGTLYGLIWEFTSIDGTLWTHATSLDVSGLQGAHVVTDLLVPALSEIVVIIDVDELQKIQVTTVTGFEVEPSRIKWFTESVNTITMSNIERCNSEEDPNTLIDIVTYDSGNKNIALGDGYNTELAHTDNILSISADIGIGQGLSPDYGNNAGSCEAIDPDEIDGVFSINGLLPDDGDIAVDVSSSLFIEQQEGQITIARRLS